jgi:predicted MFS family arabinose efflux permease
MFFFNKRAFFSLVSCALIGIFTAFYSAILSLVVIGFGLNPSAAGYIFAIPCLTFAVSSFLVTYIVDKLPRRLFIFFSFLLTVISLFLMGPSELLNMPNLFGILLLGIALNGAA